MRAQLFRARPADCLGARPNRAPVDPCPLVEQAYELRGRLTPSAADYVQAVAGEFNLEGNLRIQQGLLREDLIWQSRGFTPLQIDVLVFVSVAISLHDADSLAEELSRSLERSAARSKMERRLQNLNLYRAQALSLLNELSPRLRNIPDLELRFGF